MFAFVHPIEMLRAVARSRRGPPGELAAEAAWGLAALAEEEPAAVLPACRRLLERQPGLRAPLVADCQGSGGRGPGSGGRALRRPPHGGPDLGRAPLGAPVGPDEPSRRAVRQGGVGEVASADVVVIEVDAISVDAMVVPSSRRGLLQAAAASETPVWIESGVGRVLPPKLWSALSTG